MHVTVSPAPTDEEAAAIVAAMDALWPKPVVVVVGDSVLPASPWRFSGRWWSKPLTARRERPFVGR